MASGSMWMFDLIPINEGCGAAFVSTVPPARDTPRGADPQRRFDVTVMRRLRRLEQLPFGI